MKTLEDLEQLKECGFGRPSPRHGLRLLYWFTTECVEFNQNSGMMLSCCDPETGNFGFHKFENKRERHSGNLLPVTALPYYGVGNLSRAAAYSLPRYVRKAHTGLLDDSNMDRIIVSFNKNNNTFDKVYVTQHSDQWNFSKNSTYNISRSLVLIIRELPLDKFLLKTGYLSSSSPKEPRNQNPWCPAKQTTSSMDSNLHPAAVPPLDRPATTSAPDQNITSPEALATPSICSPATTSSTNQDMYLVEFPLIFSKNRPQGHHAAPPTTSTSIPVTSTEQYIHLDLESSSVMMKSQIREHREAPPTPFMHSPTSQEVESSSTTMESHTQENHEVLPTVSTGIPVTISSTDQTKAEYSPIMMKSPNQRHREAPSTSFINRPAHLQTTSQDFQPEVKSSSTTMKIHTKEQHEAPPTLLTFIPVTVSSTDQTIHLKVEHSLIMMKEHHDAPPTLSTCIPTPFGCRPANTSPANQDICTKTEPSSPSEEIPPNKPSTMSSKNQSADNESSPFPQLNPSFWAFYFLCLLFYLYWRNVAQMFSILIFASSIFFQQRRNRRTREDQTRNTATWVVAPTAGSSGNRYVDTKSSPGLRVSFMFLGFYFLSVYFFFFFFWGKITQLFTTGVFLHQVIGKMRKMARRCK